MKTLIPRLTALLVLALAPLTGGCAPTVLDWSEEVKLHDGKIIVVKRHDELGVSGLPLARRGLRKYWQFCYAPMGIHWKSKPDYFPETFDIVEGKAYAKVSISGIQCKLHDYPKTNALYFRWDGKAWQKIAYEDYPKGLRYNMLGSTHYDDDGKRDVHGLVTIAEKEKRAPMMYYVMRKLPNVTGLNETPAYRDICEKEKSERSQTDRTPEVFLPATHKDCN